MALLGIAGAIRASSALRRARVVLCGVVAVTLQACAAQTASDPGELLATIFDPGGDIHATDRRAAFHSIFCAINETRGPLLPDYRACSDALRTVSGEPDLVAPPYTAAHQVRPMTIFLVPGLGHECFNDKVGASGVLQAYAKSLGHTLTKISVNGLGNSSGNADLIRESVMQAPQGSPDQPVVMIAYSKGANDVLAALALYPEVAERVSAVVSISGAIAGSPLALHARDWALDLLAAMPGVDCEVPEETALTSLRPDIRRAWLEEHPLPETVAYYSVVSFPEKDRVSKALRPTYRALARHDSRNDGQLIASDQVVPGSQLLAFVNGDHWAIALPIARLHPTLEYAGITRNDFPLEVLFEAILEYVDLDLDAAL